ncbi:MAG: hypothetical protein GY696_17170, partial [Gammaproteobacteria bacterium]|nr:hypothetical protein [Gammaproteobacteria bacterium]
MSEAKVMAARRPEHLRARKQETAATADTPSPLILRWQPVALFERKSACKLEFEKTLRVIILFCPPMEKQLNLRLLGAPPQTTGRLCRKNEAGSSAPRPWAASPYVRSRGIRPQTPVGAPPQTSLGAPPPDSRWVSAPNPAGVSAPRPPSCGHLYIPPLPSRRSGTRAPTQRSSQRGLG